MAPFQVPRSYVNYIHELIVSGTTLQFTLIHRFCLCIISKACHIKLPFTCLPCLLQSKPHVSVHVHLQQDTTTISASQPSIYCHSGPFTRKWTFLCARMHTLGAIYLLLVGISSLFTRTRSRSRSPFALKFLFVLQRVRSKDT